MMHHKSETSITIEELENGYVVIHRKQLPMKETADGGGDIYDTEETSYIANTYEEVKALLMDLLKEGNEKKSKKENEAIPNAKEEME